MEKARRTVLAFEYRKEGCLEHKTKEDHIEGTSNRTTRRSNSIIYTRRFN